MTTTRAVVLARGLGTRMQSADTGAVLTDAQRQAADAGMKAMMPIGGRPFLDFVLSAAADAGIDRVGIVVAPDYEALREYYVATSPPSRIALDFVVQARPLGTANAVLAAEPFCGGAPFLVMNGDNLYPVDVLREMATIEEPALPGFDMDDLVRSSNIAASRIRAFALVQTDADGYLTRIVEKPDAGELQRSLAEAFGGGGRVSMNCWRFDRRIFDACRDVPRSTRGELELPAAVGLAVARGVRFRVTAARGPVLDLSQRADAAEITRRLAGTTPRP